MRKPTATMLPLAAITIALSLTACSTAPSAHSSRTATAAPVQLPRAFPVHDVPVIPGKLLVASGDAVDGWSITVEPKNGDLATAESLLQSAGLTITRKAKTSATLADHDYTVSVQTPGHAITYLVTKE